MFEIINPSPDSLPRVIVGLVIEVPFIELKDNNSYTVTYSECGEKVFTSSYKYLLVIVCIISLVEFLIIKADFYRRDAKRYPCKLK